MKYFWMVFLSMAALTVFSCKADGNRTLYEEPIHITESIAEATPSIVVSTIESSPIVSIYVEQFDGYDPPYVSDDDIRNGYPIGQVDHIIWKVTVVKRRTNGQ